MAKDLVENYYGGNAETKKWMDKADAYIRQISRLRREGKSTIKADDKLAIMEAIWHWDNAYDALDKESFMDIMTDDVYFFGNAWSEVKGKASMGDWWDLFTQTFSGKRHNISNFEIHGTDAEATVLSYLTVIERVKHTSVVGTALYFDKFVKQGGRWLIKERYQILDPGMSETAYGQELYGKYLSTLKK